MAKAKSINKYAIELANVIEKRSVEELDKFIQEHKDNYEPEFIKRWEKASETVKMMTLCKIACNQNLVSKKTKKWAKKWLTEHGFSEVIW